MLPAMLATAIAAATLMLMLVRPRRLPAPAAAMVCDALRVATWAAFASVTQAGAAGWFAHRGYIT